jgi:tetratricopeptide (TPR) repeat protein
LQLKSALSDNPHFVKGYLLLALLYIGTDNYEKARVTLRRVLKIDKANSLAVHYLREMGDTEENIIEMRKQNVDNDGLLDDDYLEEIVVADDDFVNNKPAMEAMAADTSYQSKVLGGQNPLAMFCAGAEKIDLSNLSAYDQGCNEEFQHAMKNYFDGKASLDDALNLFYKAVEEKYPELTH